MHLFNCHPDRSPAEWRDEVEGSHKIMTYIRSLGLARDDKFSFGLRAVLLVAGCWLLVAAPAALAQGLGLPAIVPGSDQAPSGNVYTGTDGEQTAADRYATGDYTLCDFLNMLATIVQIMFQIAAGGALFLFIWTSFGMITNFGDTEKAQKAFHNLRNIFYGIAIMLAAWFIVNAIVVTLSGTTPSSKGEATIFSKPWNNLNSICKNK